MKNLRFILAFLSVVAVAGELQYEPATPMRGKSISFTYTADPEYFSEPDSLWLVVYVFDDKRFYPTAYDVRLSRTKGSTYQGRLDTIPQEAVFLLFRIHSGRETDDNRGRMWDAIVHDKGKPVWGSYYRAALSYLGNGGVSSITRRPDLDRAYEFLRQSLETHPEHLAAKFAYAGVRFDRKEIQQADLNQTFERLLALPWDSTNEMQVRSRSRALRVLGRTDDAENLEQWFAKKYPTSDLAEEVERNYCAAARTPEEFRDRIRSYAQRYPWSPMAVKMYADLVNYYLQQGNGDAALQTVNSYPFPSGVTTAPPASLLNMVAVAFVRQDSLLRLAQQYIEWAIRSFEAISVDDRARFISPSEFRWQQREMVGICYDTWGYVLYRLGRLEEAIDAFQTCERILGPFASGDMLEHQSEALMAAGRRRESLDVARRAIATGRAISQTVMRFLQSSTDTATINAEYRALRQQARYAKLRRLRQEMLNQPVLDLQLRRNDGSTFFLRDVVLTTLDGRKIKLGDLKGKVVVLDFWATWCGPCRISMPYMQQLYEKYQGNKDVEILLVNCWERVDDRVAHVKKYLANNPNFTFPVALDLRDEAVAGFGVTGIPTKFYLDRNGVVQFKEVGFPGAEVFVEESSDRIEVLLRQ
ncbi:MAG: redoxin domain-containing protein [Candidatus Kapabacteria bacterium]|nr:redoxin domain-containing protein [Candidatus Kapabacteria bacterium]MCX7936798.1 redoxin domain-containing protein [Chlorobiota bacterium]